MAQLVVVVQAAILVMETLEQGVLVGKVDMVVEHLSHVALQILFLERQMVVE
jgi:hypothetical protein